MSRMLSFWVTGRRDRRVMRDLLSCDGGISGAAVPCRAAGGHIWPASQTGFEQSRRQAANRSGSDDYRRVLLLVLVPMSMLIAFAALEGRELVSQLDVGSLKQKTSQLRASLDLNIDNQAELVTVSDELSALNKHFSESGISHQKEGVSQAHRSPPKSF